MLNVRMSFEHTYSQMFASWTIHMGYRTSSSCFENPEAVEKVWALAYTGNLADK
jgi:hypothetical protein